MNSELVRKAAGAFIHSENLSVESIGNGLIHHTYKISTGTGQKAILLQAINQTVFKKPDDILHNYARIYQFLQQQQGASVIPAPLTSHQGGLVWKDEVGNCWRATAFVEHSYSPLIASDEDSAYRVGHCFARFTASLAGLDTSLLKEIIPGFHNLSLRYLQFEESIHNAGADRLLKSTHLISELRERKFLVDFYESTSDARQYPLRVMHHDCKISNILFDERTDTVICPVDLDTVMPGKFFSDLGDMIRTMACSLDENNNNWEAIRINPSFYQAILQGYQDGMGQLFTGEEKAQIHYAGLLLTYMQALRFLSDFLNEDKYYKTSYPEQNLNRALNQLVLLERLENFLADQFAFHFK